MTPFSLAVQLTLALATDTDLKRIEDVVNFDPFMGGNAL
jgi:hypothetical protein